VSIWLLTAILSELAVSLNLGYGIKTLLLPELAFRGRMRQD